MVMKCEEYTIQFSFEGKPREEKKRKGMERRRGKERREEERK